MKTVNSKTWADDHGGAIYNDGQNLTIKNCTFNGNIADDKSGGAIYSTQDVIIESSTFTNNEAYTYGGAISCAGTLSVNANQCTGPYTSFFNNNKARCYSGGAIEAETVNIKNAEFKENFALNNGGAIDCDELNVTYSLFESNNAKDFNGGGINVVSGGRNPYIKGCIFKSNSAHTSGGAVYANNDLYVDNCTFENNMAGYIGGAIYAVRIYINTAQSENESYNTYFKENSVSNSNAESNRGGAIFVYSGGRIVNAYFADNTAKVDGGAIYVNQSGNIQIDHCLFENNHATGSVYQCYGGAICAESDVCIHNSTFKNNYADDYGGAIYANNVRINPDRESETADTFFIDNRADDNKGGAIYAENDVYARNTEFTGNSALVDGGAIYAENNVETVRSTFESNKAKDNDGGAIYAENNVYARNTAFINNAALVDGGAIYAENNVETVRSTFESNQATGASVSRCYGGAIRAEENAKINNCTFKNNHAYNRGGAVYASTVTIEGEKSTFEGNSANDYGGAIYTDTFTNDVSHVSFINNRAEAGDGGAVYINNENWITFTDCVFIDNRAINKGGAIYMDSKYSHLTIRNNAFIGNSAAEGNSVYTYGYYDEVSRNYWTVIPTEYNNQLVEWKAWPYDNIQHTDSNPVTFTLEIVGPCYANLTSGVKISFVHQDGTFTTIPIIADYFTIYGGERIEIEDKEVSDDGITIWFTPSEVGTYELTAFILDMGKTITINVADGGALVPVPLPEDDIIRPDIPKPYIPVPPMATIKK